MVLLVAWKKSWREGGGSHHTVRWAGWPPCASTTSRCVRASHSHAASRAADAASRLAAETATPAPPSTAPRRPSSAVGAAPKRSSSPASAR
jgi:hypothetical protein